MADNFGFLYRSYAVVIPDPPKEPRQHIAILLICSINFWIAVTLLVASVV